MSGHAKDAEIQSESDEKLLTQSFLAMQKMMNSDDEQLSKMSGHAKDEQLSKMSGHAKDEQLSKMSGHAKIQSEHKRKEDADIRSKGKMKADGEIPTERDEPLLTKSLQDQMASSESEDEPLLTKSLQDHMASLEPGLASSRSGSTPKRLASWMNKQRSKIKTDTEIRAGWDDEAERDDVLFYSDCSDITANEIKKELNDKRRQRIWIPEDIWMDYIRGNPKDRNRFSSDASIFKVRMFLKDIKREAYVPQRVSLGPYHEGRPGLPPMNHHKGRALRRMMIRRNKRMGIDSNATDFASRAMNVILKLEDKIRDIYEEPIHCDGEMLARMVCWDGCFILEVLRTLGWDPKEKNDPSFGRDPNEENDPIFGENQVAASNLLKDILMLENQIPCIVLQELLQLEYPRDKHVGGTLFKVLVDGTYGLFKNSEDKSALMQCNGLFTPVQPAHHLLAFLHKVIVHRPSNPVKPKDQEKNCIGHCLIMLQDTNNNENIPPAVELKHAGIKFLSFKGGIKEIDFHPNSATLYLPSVSITYGTEVLFRNLIAFEICRPSEGNYVTSYVALMNDLIDSEKDVAWE